VADARARTREPDGARDQRDAHEFDEPLIVDSSRAETELNLRATPLADALEQTVHWNRAQTAP
jgi:hypothetical protein